MRGYVALGFAFVVLLSVIHADRPAKCNLPKKVGECKALIPRYYFDTATNGCKLFNYGGCHGNANNFDTMEQCMGNCTQMSQETK